MLFYLFEVRGSPTTSVIKNTCMRIPKPHQDFDQSLSHAFISLLERSRANVVEPICEIGMNGRELVRDGEEGN